MILKDVFQCAFFNVSVNLEDYNSVILFIFYTFVADIRIFFVLQLEYSFFSLSKCDSLCKEYHREKIYYRLS